MCLLFHTGLRISEFCGLTLDDVDLERRIITVDHQLQRMQDGTLYICLLYTSPSPRD